MWVEPHTLRRSTSFVDALFSAHLGRARMFQLVVVLLLAGSAECRADVLQSLAARLSRELWDTFTNASGSTASQLQELSANQSPEPVNGSAIAQQTADDISAKLAVVRAALNETAVVAEGLYSKHQNQTCCSTVCQYGMGYDADRCSMFCNTSSISYISTGRQFGLETGENGTRQCVMETGDHDADSCSAVEDGMRMGESAVHIPRDMLEDDPDVLCFVQWTDMLTEQFSANSGLYDNSTIFLQYVGSDTRLLRFAPPLDWSSLSQCDRCPLTLQDTFELGRRPWYTNTISGEKYFVILLDVSGSMAGFQSILARTAIAELLKALTANDYFQIFQVGEGERSRPFKCFPNKTRATPENVLVMNQVVLSMPDSNNVGRAHFSSPLKTALSLLGNSTECHQVLVIFTDGERETDLPSHLIRDFNSDKEVQVFTFLVGYGSDRANLETVACQNRGRMGRIREYFDIIPAVLLITGSLNQSPSSDDVYYTTYRGVHGNIALTMGKPLWISDGIGNQSYSRRSFGVVAMDVAHFTLLETALQNHSIGASGYGFIVDNNGQLVAHPLISMEYIEGLSDDNLLSLDMDYYEHPLNTTQWLAVRRGILGGGRGQHSLLTWSTLYREEEYVLRNTTYSYAPIDGTPYTLVVVTPSDLWLVAPPTSTPNESNVFIQFSSDPQQQCSEENYQRHLRRVEGTSLTTHLLVLAPGKCGNESTALLWPLLIIEKMVGVVGTTLSPESTDQLITSALEEGGREGGWSEMYVIDETAVIVAASPSQSGWFPGLYPAVQSQLVVHGVFQDGNISGYELRPGQEEGERCRDCDSLQLYVKSVEVYQLVEPADMELTGEVACDNNDTLMFHAIAVPNTTLTLVALSGPTYCLHGNTTHCSERPIRLQCIPCVCGCMSCDRYRGSPPSRCPATTNFMLCATIKPHPCLLVVIVTGFIITLTQLICSSY